MIELRSLKKNTWERLTILNASSTPKRNFQNGPNIAVS